MKQKTLFMAAMRRLLWAVALSLPVFEAQAAAVLTTLHSFQPSPNGASPSGLVEGSDGYFYGTTYEGGTNGGYGTVFKVSTNGALISLYSFTGGLDGSSPQGEVVQGNDGFFYGTTESGGRSNAGTVFKISTNGALTGLFSFSGGTDGGSPQSDLVEGVDGYFYGTTSAGGDTNLNDGRGYGTVFKISPNGALSSLHSFTGGMDGIWPNGLVQATDGNFYGTTYEDGRNNDGTVFRISPAGALTTLYSFGSIINRIGNVLDGAHPGAPLLQGGDGYLYGTTEAGGDSPTFIPGYGTVFKISTNGVLTSLYSFGLYGSPVSGLVQGPDGYFYGTTSIYGTMSEFKISTNGALTTLWAITNLGTNIYSDVGVDSRLARGRDGNFYGTTFAGGMGNNGTVFQISSNGGFTELASFGGNDGGWPEAGLVQGSDGNLYGTTWLGGTNGGYGTVFHMSTDGALTILHSFNGTDGAEPESALVWGRDGYLYGTTSSGGTSRGYGSVFKISTNGALRSLYSFIGDDSGPTATDGVTPNGLAQGSDGNFYGTTQSSATYDGHNDGTVFEINTNGSLASLYSFGSVFWGTSSSPLDGSNPIGGLVQGSDGSFYGTTSRGGTNGAGTVFKISTNGALTRLYSFGATNDGLRPTAGLVQGSDGYFYGTTRDTVFKFSTNGALTTLSTNVGSSAALVQGSDGYFYGTTGGTVFRINTNGAPTTLYVFAGGDDGSAPNGLIQASDGSFYGTTSSGGAGGFGTVYRLTIVPEFQAVTLTSTTLSLTWSTEAGATYQLQCNSDLSLSNWINVGPALTATGATLSTTDSLTNGPLRFYRLVLAP